MRVFFEQYNGRWVEKTLENTLLENDVYVAFSERDNMGMKAIILLSSFIETLHSKGIICDKNIVDFLEANFTTILHVDGVIHE